MGRLSKAELEVLGGAFAPGYEAARAQRLYQDGLGATEADDLALALGFPMLVAFGPDVDDPGAYARARICKALRRLDPWPRNAAIRAVRAIASTWETFPNTLTAEAEAELASSEGFEAADVSKVLERLFAIPPIAWFHTFEFVFLLEALVGGEAVLEAALGLIVPRAEQWTVLGSSHRIVMLALGYLYDRLSEPRAFVVRPKLVAVLESYRKTDPDLSNAQLTGVATRKFDLALHGREGYARSAERTIFGPDRNFDAFFLDRDAWRELTQPLKPLPSHASASVQWLVQGGPSELARIGEWSKQTFQGSKEEAQRYFVGEWSRAATRESAALLVDMFARSLVKDDVARLTRRGAARLAPHIAAIAEAADTSPKLKKAAKALLAAVAPA
jgi:hypothetical protein